MATFTSTLSGPIFYSKINMNAWINMPVYQRIRHPYRGVRRSALVNQELLSFLYDVRVLTEQADTYRQELGRRFTALEGGATIGAINSYVSGQQTIVYNTTVTPAPLGRIIFGENALDETMTDRVTYDNSTIQTDATTIDGIETLALRTQRLLDRVIALEVRIG